MRIAEMLLREDFYKILADTVTEYYRKVYGKEIVFSYEKTPDCEKLIVNGKLSFVSRFPAPFGLRKFMLSEYNVRGSRVKYVAGKAAALLVSILPQLGKLCNAYISRDVLGKNTFISPQNRSIRFFDYDAMTVDCIIKSGFTSKYFANQLAFRKQYHYDFMLPLLDSGEHWFREPILTGHPLARVTDEAHYQKAMYDALTGMKQLATDTIGYEEASDYAQKLLNKIGTLLEEAKERKHIAHPERTLQIAQKAADLITASAMRIPTCVSHGDFQGGNIWVDDRGKTWLYDWETVGRRSVWYDSAVLQYSLRRVYGWQDFLQENLPAGICGCDPEKIRTEAQMTVIKAAILLEDIVFYLDDMLELPKDWGTQIFDDFAARMWGLWNDR